MRREYEALRGNHSSQFRIINFKFREGDYDPHLRLVIPKKNQSIISTMLGDDTVIIIMSQKYKY